MAFVTIVAIMQLPQLPSLADSRRDFPSGRERGGGGAGMERELTRAMEAKASASINRGKNELLAVRADTHLMR